MKRASKLRPDNASIFILIIALVIILIAAELWIGEDSLWLIRFLVMAAAAAGHLVVLIRTRNTAYGASMLFYALCALTFLAASRDNRPLALGLAIGAMIMLVLMMHALITRKIKWWYREIMELAAQPVDEAGDGFTSRPFPAGKASYTKEEILGFAGFLLRHVIAYPVVEENRVVITVPRNMFRHLLLMSSDYSNGSYVAFGFNGDITVNIVKKDYQKYKEELTFDRLCSSFGNLFRDFLELFQRGESGKIIERLKTL